MAYQARTDKFGRAYYTYDPDEPNAPPGPDTEVLPAILSTINIKYVDNTEESA